MKRLNLYKLGIVGEVREDGESVTYYYVVAEHRDEVTQKALGENGGSIAQMTIEKVHPNFPIIT